MATKQKSRSQSGPGSLVLLGVAVVAIFALVGGSSFSGALGRLLDLSQANSPQGTTAPDDGDTIALYIEWDTKRLPDSALGQTNIQWSINGRKSGIRADKARITRDGSHRSWSLGMQVFGNNEIPYDGKSFTAVSMWALPPTKMDSCRSELNTQMVDSQDEPNRTDKYNGVACSFPR